MKLKNIKVGQTLWHKTADECRQDKHFSEESLTYGAVQGFIFDDNSYATIKETELGPVEVVEIADAKWFPICVKKKGKAKKYWVSRHALRKPTEGELQ